MKGMQLEWEGHDKALSTKLWEFFKEEYLVDFSVTCHGQTMKVHKFVLALMFPILKESLRSSGTFHFDQEGIAMGGSTLPLPQGLNLDNIADHAEDMDYLIQFAYTGKATVPDEHADCLMRIADNMEIKSLKDSLGQWHDKDKLAVKSEQNDTTQTEHNDTTRTERNDTTKTKLEKNTEESTDVSTNEDDHEQVIEVQAVVDEDSKPSNDSEDSIDSLDNYSDSEDDELIIRYLRSKTLQNNRSQKRQIEGDCSTKGKTIKSVHDYKQKANNRTAKEQTANESLDPSKQLFTCRLCMKGFERRTDLDIHREWNCGTEPPVCKYCGHTTNRKNILLRHIMAKHHVDADGKPLEKNVKCPKCNFICYAKHQLRAHSQAKHDLIGKYRCKECSFTAPSRSRLVKHERIIHQNRRDYMCEECGNRYQTSGTLNHHVLITHKGVKPYLCEICGMEYRDKSCYNLHVQSHEGSVEQKYACETCEYRTTRRYTLRIHMRKEHGIELASGKRHYEKLPASTSSNVEPLPTASEDN